MKISKLKQIPGLSIWLWVLAFFIVATNLLLTSFDKPYPPQKSLLLVWLLLLFMTAVGARTMIVSASGRFLAERRWNDLWPRIVSASALTGLICRFFNCIYPPVNFLFGALALYLCIYFGTANLAFVMLHSGQYSVAEYLNRFAQQPNVSKTYALTTAHCDTRHVCKMKSVLDSDRKIAAIARVYGEKSIQLGHHYQLLANEYLNSALGSRKARDYQAAFLANEAAEKYAHSALYLCRKHGDNGCAIESIGIIAMSRLGREDRAGARAALLDALDCPPLVAKPGPICTSDEDLWYVAKQINDPQLLARIRPRIERNDLASRSAFKLLRRSELEPDTTWVKVALISSLLLILVKDSERCILTLLFARRWRRQLALGTSSFEQLKLLDNLTTLYLYDKKFDKADSCSKLMLRRSEELVIAA